MRNGRGFIGKWIYYGNKTEKGKNQYILMEGNMGSLNERGLPMRDGKWTYYFENGQIEEEKNYKNGKLISSKCWDEDGNEKECN